jgi:NDP-sugar pyrophosphorylase family protein
VKGPWITDIHVKKSVSGSNLGLAGFFWVKDGRAFACMESSEQDADVEMCADHVFRRFVQQGRRVMAFTVDEYVHLGTPEEYLEHQYWTNRPYALG